MFKVHATTGGNAGYTRAAASQYQRQFGGSRRNAMSVVRGNIRGTTGAGSGRAMGRGNFVNNLPGR